MFRSPGLAATPQNATQNLTTYVPECAQACLEDSLSGVCSGPEDAECLCDNIATIGPGSRSCVMGACSGNSTAQTAARTGYMNYCSDTGHPMDGSWRSPPDYSNGWQTSTTMGTSTTASTSTSAAATSSATSAGPITASDSAGGGGDGGDDLSKGAIAGIAVGGGIACILLTGGLLFFAFRLGKKHYKRKQEGGGGPQGPEQGEADPQKEEGSDTMSPRRSKAQLDGNPVSELHAGIVDSGLDPIKELPTHERPAELSADPISYDSPILPQSAWR
ncbi:hypothetical protein F4820DRAFT_406759 [Hypoxylon rubiginosum]|uniref:Uncharacterized protein n=1 Tax=Hypoxylon rubiginosum TaxID=110542 RepID=A0ACB9ZE91_9PEZI|nr:hypothetical protein F4820DRAFT_406759 [Hypoxylon rubiginosum]